MLHSTLRPPVNDPHDDDLALLEREEETLSPVDRVFSAIARLEQLISGYQPGGSRVAAELEEEINQLHAENTHLRSERQELVQAVRTLKTQNDQLARQMDEISERLDAAIGKISELMQE